jgi:hypothetical protein
MTIPLANSYLLQIDYANQFEFFILYYFNDVLLITQSACLVEEYHGR